MTESISSEKKEAEKTLRKKDSEWGKVGQYRDMDNGYKGIANGESSARLWALEPQVRRLAETDAAFEAALIASPLEAIRARFGEAAMPNEGEYMRPISGGGFEMVFPKSDVAWTFGVASGELSDEMLEAVSGGNSVDLYYGQPKRD